MNKPNRKDTIRKKDAPVKEISVLRRKVAELEKEKSLKAAIKEEKDRIEHTLEERAKELNCMFGLSDLFEQYGNNIEQVLQSVPALLKASWKYPEITCARVGFDKNEYRSPGFRRSQWKQSADINVAGKKVGEMEVYYLKKMPELDEGPFMKEERLLIEEMARRTGKAAERIQTRKQLEVEQDSLRNMNIALREVLVKVQDEKRDIGEAIQANVDKIIMPILHALESEVAPERKKYVSLIKRNLEEIITPFTSKLSKEFMSLTPAEVQICNMIKNGLTTKEIAQLRHISIATVSRHREHIRKKLHIANKNINLATYLNTFMIEDSLSHDRVVYNV